MVYGLWFIVFGLWLIVYGLWFIVYGLWFMVYGLWFIIHGLGLRGKGGLSCLGFGTEAESETFVDAIGEVLSGRNLYYPRGSLDGEPTWSINPNPWTQSQKPVPGWSPTRRP
jgi:hypothetical protein